MKERQINKLKLARMVQVASENKINLFNFSGGKAQRGRVEAKKTKRLAMDEDGDASRAHKH